MAPERTRVERLITLRLEPAVYEELEKLAITDGRPVANLARRAVHEYIARHGGKMMVDGSDPDPVAQALAMVKERQERQIIERLLEGTDVKTKKAGE